MRWLISALGAVLAIAGAAAIVYGMPYMQLEFGWTAVIAGTTALSGGIVTLALGALLFALRALGQGLARPAASARAGRARPAGGRTAPSQPPGEVRPGESAADAGSLDFTPALEPVRSPRPHGEARALPKAAPAPSVAIDPSAARGAPAPASRPAEDPGDRAPRPEAGAPSIVGRYDVDGAAYVLFSDGSIEVETEDGTHRFASMQDLRAHMAAEQRTS